MQRNFSQAPPLKGYLSFYTNADMPKLNRIKVVLVEKDKTAKWLAERVGRDRSTVSRWCTNDMQPPLEVLYQIADILEVDVRDLLVPNEKQTDQE